MDGTILGQGSFVANFTGLANPNPGNAEVSNANATYIQIPSIADFMWVRNYTESSLAGTDAAYFNGTANAFVGIEFYWQRGMPIGSAFVKYYANTSGVITGDLISSGGFTLFDPSGQTPNALPLLGPSVATTAITNVTRPVVSTGNTAGISVGTIVRLAKQSGDTEIASSVTGIDFVVGAVTANTTFTLGTSTNALANAPGLTTGTGHYRIVNYDPLFYPRARYIVNITQATNGQVSTSIPHGLTVGQEVRFNIPTVSGMTQLNGTAQNNFIAQIITSIVDDYNFTINVDTTNYTAFTWPTVAQQPSSFPEVTPLGIDTSTAAASNINIVPSIGGQQIFNTNTGILADSTVNTGYLGMILGIGATGPIATVPILGPSGAVSWSAGNVGTGDLVYWVAGKSTYGGL